MSAPAKRRLSWRLVAQVALWTLNAIGLAVILGAFFASDVGFDWALFTEAGRRFTEGGLYDWGEGVSYRYSPVLAALFSIIAPIGYLGWTALHFLSLIALGRRMALIALVSFPFWADVYNGNTMTFVFVAAVTAIRGSTIGTLVFLALAVLIPRPLMLPIAAWLVWNRRDLLLPMTAVFLAHAGLVFVTGWGNEWVGNLLTRSADDLGNRGDFGPSRIVGLWWYPVGLAASAWFVARGRLGLASLAASPYWLSHYVLMPLIDVDRRDQVKRRQQP